MSALLTDAQAAEQEALQDAATAEQAATQLEQRLESGDASVTSEQLEEASRFARWARSHAKGVSARRAKAEADVAVADARAAIDQAAEITTLDAELVERWADTVRAVAALVPVAQRRSQTIWEQQRNLNIHRDQLAAKAGKDLADLGALPAVYEGEAGYRIPDRGIDVHDVRPDALLAEAISAGNAGRLHLGQTTLNGRPSLAGSSLAARITGWDAAAAAISPPSQEQKVIVSREPRSLPAVPALTDLDGNPAIDARDIHHGQPDSPADAGKHGYPELVEGAPARDAAVDPDPSDFPGVPSAGEADPHGSVAAAVEVDSPGWSRPKDRRRRKPGK